MQMPSRGRIRFSTQTQAEGKYPRMPHPFLSHTLPGLLAVLLGVSSGCATVPKSSSSAGYSSQKSTPPSTAVTPVVPPAAAYHLTLDPQSLFGECLASPEGDAVQLECGEMLVTYVESTSATPESFLEQQRAAIADNLGDAVQIEDPIALSLEQQLLTALQVTVMGVDAPSTPELKIYALAVAGQDGVTRGAMCSSGATDMLEQERCLKLIAYSGLHGIPFEYLATLDPTAEGFPAFLGQPLLVPEGCEAGEVTDESGHIRCTEGSLSWFIMQESEQADRVAAAMANRLKTARGVVVEERAVPCALGSEQARCTQFFTVEAGEPKNAVLARSTLEELFVVTLCYHAGSTETLHPVCSSLLRLGGALPKP